MAEPLEGYDMENFNAWAAAWAICLLAAAFLAVLITTAPEPPVHVEPIRVQLGVTQLRSWRDPQPREYATLLAVMPRVAPQPEAPWEDPAQLVRGHIRQLIEAPALESVTPPKPVYPPATTPAPAPAQMARVTDLWAAYEARQQEARRTAIEAASAGRPDTGYTYPGAHQVVTR
jgi:hypothetical protein